MFMLAIKETTEAQFGKDNESRIIFNKKLGKSCRLIFRAEGSVTFGWFNTRFSEFCYDRNIEHSDIFSDDLASYNILLYLDKWGDTCITGFGIETAKPIKEDVAAEQAVPTDVASSSNAVIETIHDMIFTP